MGDFQATTTVAAAEDRLFDYLSTVDNLPQYFPRVTSATSGAGEEVHTAARTPDGQRVEGDAWFRVDTEAHRIEWGSEGHSGYHGSLETHANGASTDVHAQVHTTRVPDGDNEVQQSLDETLANIKRLVEQEHVAS